MNSSHCPASFRFALPLGDPEGFAPSRTSERASASGTGLLQEKLGALARELDFQGGVYVHLGHAVLAPRQAAGLKALRFVASSIWDRRLYLEGGPLMFGPSAAPGSWIAGPFAWTTSPAAGLTNADMAFRANLRERGIRACVLTPIHDYAAGPAYLNLYSIYQGEAERQVRENGPALAFAASRFHEQAKGLTTAARAANGGSLLTPREIDCLRLAALGLTAQETADALQVTVRTIEFHLKNAVEKFGAANKVRAVALAVRQGLIEP